MLGDVRFASTKIYGTDNDASFVLEKQQIKTLYILSRVKRVIII